jgi:uncharacterized BrkB/YihY/UPF0761 family membrane protein
MVPMLLVLVSVFGVFGFSVGAARSAGSRLGLTAYAANVIEQARAQSSVGALVGLGVGLFAMFFASRSALKSLRIVHSLAWNLPMQRRPVRAISSVIFAASAIGLWIAIAAIGVLRSHGVLGWLAIVLLRTALYGGISVWISAVTPHPDGVTWRDYLPGALAMAISIQVLQVFSEVYLVYKAQHLSKLYGGLGVAVVLLLWLYIVGRMIVASAMLNATLWEQRRTKEAHGGASPNA